MPLVKPTYTNLRHYKLNLQQDLTVTTNLVHDEFNLGIEKHLLKPLLKKIINKFTAKNIMDKLGQQHLNFLYDSEFNTKTGAFTGEGYKDTQGFSPYDYPIDREESLARQEFLDTIQRLKDTTPQKPLEYTTPQKALEDNHIDLKKYETKEGYILKIKDLTYHSLVKKSLINILSK